jgi:hypothetical protein
VKTLHSQRRPYFLADIEPTIAVAETLRWEREIAAAAPPLPPLTSFELSKQARAMRSAYQQELIRRFARMIMPGPRPRAAHALVAARREGR